MIFTSEEGQLGGVEPPPQPARLGLGIKKFVRNSASNLVRTTVTALISIALPRYLTHHLSVQLYGTWVLILQLGAYVGYLNLGVQTALAKFIAEYHTKEDHAGCGHAASVGLWIMLGASAVGLLLTLLLAIFAPKLFGDLPPDLLHDVRISVIFVGVSLSFNLLTSVFSAIFLGLERFHIPMVITVGSRVLYAVAVCGAVGMHRGIIWMAIAAAGVNLLTSLAEILAWRRLAGFVRIGLRTINLAMLRRMAAYCSVLTVWSACMLFITGLDVTIVAHYSFNEVAYYSIAGSPTNLILMILGGAMGPLLPAASAMSVTSSPLRMGGILLRGTRYSTIILLLSGLPLLVGGYALLRLWVGPIYASHSVVFLQVLLAANIIRNLCAPYSTMVVATSSQRVATAAAITEAVLNLGSSLFLARHMGAIGVALGTLIGAVAGVTMHFIVSMQYTQVSFTLTRTRLFVGGLLRPATMALPTLVLLPFWWGAHPLHLAAAGWLAWFAATAALTWFASLSAQDRDLLQSVPGRLLRVAERV